MKGLVQKAWAFAIIKHQGQVRDNGVNYFDAHIRPVFNILSQITDDENLLCAAYLHDTLEDTDTTYEQIVSEFNWDVADLVLEVTHEGKNDQYGYFFPKLKSKRAILLKFADRLQNISDMEAWDEGRQKHYLSKSKFWKDGSSRSNEGETNV